MNNSQLNGEAVTLTRVPFFDGMKNYKNFLQEFVGKIFCMILDLEVLH